MRAEIGRPQLGYVVTSGLDDALHSTERHLAENLDHSLRLSIGNKHRIAALIERACDERDLGILVAVGRAGLAHVDALGHAEVVDLDIREEPKELGRYRSEVLVRQQVVALVCLEAPDDAIEREGCRIIGGIEEASGVADLDQRIHRHGLLVIRQLSKVKQAAFAHAARVAVAGLHAAEVIDGDGGGHDVEETGGGGWWEVRSSNEKKG